MGARRNLPAAVLREGDPGAENAVRVVPTGARMRMVGTATAGYTLNDSKARRANYTADQLQAVGRIQAVATLLAFRARAGEVPSRRDMACALDVLADAGRFFGAPSRYAQSEIRNYLPADWRESATDELVGRAVGSERCPRSGIMSNREAGLMLSVRLIEILQIEAESDGKLFLLLGTDESDAERNLRRAARDRQMDRDLKRRKREGARSAEGCSPVRISNTRRGLPDGPATFQADMVHAAVEGGAAGVPDIVAATGLPISTVKPILNRLTKAGSIVRVSRGRYAVRWGAGGLPPAVHATCTPTPLPGVGAGLNAEAAPNSGPEVQPSTPRPPSEVESNVPAFPIEGARGTAGLCPAPRGPEVKLRPASAAAPTPGSGANDDAETEGALPPHPRSRKAGPADAHVFLLPSKEALRRVHEVARTAAPVLTLSARVAAIRAALASFTRLVA
ncbi:hypothetical protein V5F40_09075 [Xanthobacter sp. DSM 14520]|uniref:hypothetical protein n=1 Tax=Xanthobacter autotrophicus (strain ATCC BAA-1158 / Py2) TaxID=78245 RepID=UPI0037269C96